MSVSPPLDSLGRRRSPAAVPGYLPDASPAARAVITQLTRRAPKRSSRSCAVAATACTATARVG
jgi:hypothetical protein